MADYDRQSSSDSARILLSFYARDEEDKIRVSPHSFLSVEILGDGRHYMTNCSFSTCPGERQPGTDCFNRQLMSTFYARVSSKKRNKLKKRSKRLPRQEIV